MKTGQLYRIVLAVATTLVLCVSCGIKAIPQTATFSFTEHDDLSPNAFRKVVDGEYTVRADVRELSASITIIFEHLKKYSISDNAVAFYADLRARENLSDTTTITDMVRGDLLLIPFDERGEPIMVSDNPGDSYFKTHVADYYQWGFNADEGDTLQSNFKIKVRNRRQLAAIMEMRDFRIRAEWHNIVHWSTRSVERAQKEGYRIVRVPQK